MKNDLFNLEEETAVVLGGTGVLGGAMAEALAGAGARVAVVGRNEERGRERVRRIEAAGDFCKLPLEAWQGVFDLNLVGGTVLPSQVFGETMLAAGRGSIINIASM